MSDVFLFLIFMIPGTFFLGVYDMLTRRFLRDGKFDEGVLLGLTLTSSGAVLFILSLVIGFPEIKAGFWYALTATVALNSFSQLIWYKAFRHEEASLIVPFRLLIPLLTVFTGFLILGEIPSWEGAGGIAVIVFGLWLLLARTGRHEGKNYRWFAMARRPGILLSIAGASLFALSFPFDKKAVVASSALFFSGLAFLSIGVINLAFHLRFRVKENNPLSFVSTKAFPLFVLAHAGGAFLTLQALNFSIAAYASSVKRLSVLWTVILSGVFLAEKDIAQRIFATVVMLIGVLIIAWLG